MWIIFIDDVFYYTQKIIKSEKKPNVLYKC